MFGYFDLALELLSIELFYCLVCLLFACFVIVAITLVDSLLL